MPDHKVFRMKELVHEIQISPCVIGVLELGVTSTIYTHTGGKHTITYYLPVVTWEKNFTVYDHIEGSH